MPAGQLSNLVQVRLVTAASGQQEPGILTGKPAEGLDQSLQTLVGQHSADESVGEIRGRYAQNAAGLALVGDVRVDPDEMTVRRQEDVVGPAEGFRPHRPRRLAVGNDGGAEPAHVEPELMVDVLVGPVVRVDVVGVQTTL